MQLYGIRLWANPPKLICGPRSRRLCWRNVTSASARADRVSLPAVLASVLLSDTTRKLNSNYVSIY